MALTKCKECGTRVSTNAKSCPSCGARRTSGCTMALAWIIGIILLFAVFGGIFSTSTSPSKRPQMIVDQELGKSFLGLTKQELIAKLGNPKKVTAGSHPQDGKYEILTYDNSNENATLFTIWENDGYVSSGYYQGRYFYQKE